MGPHHLIFEIDVNLIFKLHIDVLKIQEVVEQITVAVDNKLVVTNNG